MEDDGGLLILLFSYHFFSSLFFTHICCGVFFHPTLFCRLSVVWVDSCIGRTIKPDNPINQLSKNSGCWLSGYFAVRENDGGTQL